ncbi:zincin-like metallopeptidase domain-containing protein [uncultured Tenacibaculum sp.]|uniref:zincin-like metallopeptidase domain-containing protein n=1 Tax=uncultured Tenacibaculum sp. TaxID=174713 RepID=UPI002609B434|nr:zincin-like metallopeptidase domain-containing protein [uncultured Tenacibaculum sp.]
MITTSKFYKLHNIEVERSVLTNLLREAREEQNTNVVYRISKVLNENPDDIEFTLNIKQFNEASAINSNLAEALNSKGELRQGFVFKNGSVIRIADPIENKNDNQEITPEVLAGFDYIQADDEDLVTTLGKAVSPKEIYKMITEKVIEGVNKAKGNPAMPWDEKFQDKGGFLIPHNFDSKKPYRGVNVLLLKDGNPYAGFENPYFLTFKQVKKLKGKVKPKTKGSLVVYFTKLFSFRDAKNKKSFSTYNKEKMIEFFKSNGYDVKKFELLVSVIPILKYYKVFNGKDIEGIDFGLDKLTDLEKAKLGYVQPSKARHNEDKNSIAELILKHLPDPKVKISHQQKGAYYSPSTDTVNMPKFEAFDSANDYYRVLFHELIHSTAHPKRLDRELGGKFGSVKYAKEELIAEFGSVFLSAQAGILWYTHQNHEKYIKHWLLAISMMEKDNTLLMRSATAAQKAVDYLLQVDQDGQPLFFKELSKISVKGFEEKKALPPKKINTYQEWKNMVKPFYNEKVSLQYYKEAFNTTLNSKEALMNDVNKTYTLDKLKRMFYVNRDRKKEYVDAFYSEYLLRFFTYGTISYSFNETFESVLKRIVDKADQKYLDELLNDLRKAEEKKKKRSEHLKKSISNPETLEEFINFVKLRGESKLTPEQLEKFDKLFVEAYHKKQELKKIEVLKNKSKLNNNIDISNVQFEYNESTHTKTGNQIHVLTFVDRVEREVYNKLNSIARSFGGYYSSYRRNGAIPGFIFQTKEKSDSFLEATKNGNKPFDSTNYLKEKAEKQKEKLNKLRVVCLDRIAAAYENIERPRLTNTRRRQNISSSVIYDQEEIIRANKIAINLIDKILDNKVIGLKGLSHLTEVNSIISVIERAAYDWMRDQKNRNFFTSTSPKVEKLIKEEIEFHDIQKFLKPTLLNLNKQVFQSLMYKYEEKKGFKMIAKRLLKKAIQLKDEKYTIYVPSQLISDFDKIVKEESKTSISDSIQRPYTRYKRLLNIIGSNNYKLLRQAAREVLKAYKEVDIYNSEQKEKNKLKSLLNEVQLVKIDGFFPTPEKLTKEILNNFKIYEDDTILEPSAGIGSIAEVIRNEYPKNELTLIEKVDTLHEICVLKGFNCLNTNFINHSKKYDVIIMNPPFEKNQDIEHVMHAYSLLNDGGRLVAIMANNKENSSIKKRKEFSEFVNNNGWMIKNEPGSFKSSFKPTGVNTITVYLEKTRTLAQPKTPITKTVKENIVPVVSASKEIQTPIVPVVQNQVSKIHNTEVKTPGKNTKVLSSNDINNMNFDTLNFTGEWGDFMQNPAKNLKLAIWGKPKNGKTAGATKFANYLTNFGSILYNFADQGVNKSTQDLWKLSGLDKKDNAYLSDTRDLKELDRLCASGLYDFVFIDMINTYISRTGIKYFEFEDQFIKKYPNISFILIFEVTKSGNFKGDQGWTHLPDALITVESFVMQNQGRYGIGEYVVWKEGLKKFNPKKYDEMFGDDNQDKLEQKEETETSDFFEVVV